MTFDALYVHGAGRRGTAAWPTLGHEHGEFLSFDAGSSVQEQVGVILRTRADRRSFFFAHSIGAVPTVLAAASGALDVAGLVLVEPALYDIVRGEPPVERHISAVTEARAQAADGNLRGCWAILRPLMFGGTFDEDAWDEERPLAEYWAQTNVPWGHAVRPHLLTGIPTLVITGGWNDEYEAIAHVLAAHGARHQILVGAQHRPQDLPEFAAHVAEFTSALSH
ncbi:hypothetical protein ACSS7Z_10760 [Microbacterium sp. A82]|uniref:hypothetical protein n=1 Tax=Microbacterium sp. A82 TaxID=3450452 RepID=UPI003F3EEA4A